MHRFRRWIDEFEPTPADELFVSVLFPPLYRQSAQAYSQYLMSRNQPRPQTYIIRQPTLGNLLF